MLHHVSALKRARLALVWNKALEYVWKHTHCAAIKVNLYHYQLMKKKAGATEATMTMDSDPELKAILKERKFRWKNIANEGAVRFETQEVQNADFADQMRQSKA